LADLQSRPDEELNHVIWKHCTVYTPAIAGINYIIKIRKEPKSIKRYALWPAMDKNYVVCQTTATTCS